MRSGWLWRCGALTIAALLTTACDDGPRDFFFGLGSGTVQAVVTGRVVGPTEQPVEGADIASRLYGDPGCASGNPGDLAPTTTSPDGRFTVRIDIPFSDSFEGCVHIDVAPPSGSSLLADSAEATLELRRQPPYDSIFVEIRLADATPMGR